MKNTARFRWIVVAAMAAATLAGVAAFRAEQRPLGGVPGGR